jgi:hypothetical protein
MCLVGQFVTAAAFSLLPREPAVERIVRPAVMKVSTLDKLNFRTVLSIGGLALVGVILLAVVLRLQRGIGGGTNSVGDTTVQYVSMRGDGAVNLLIWSDAFRSAGTHAESALFGSPRVEGFFTSVDGKRISWTWKAPSERGGDFQLNGTSYDLANGTVFLVSTKGGQVRVTQLDVDLSTVQANKQGFEAFAKDQPRVAQFVAEAAGGK